MRLFSEIKNCTVNESLIQYGEDLMAGGHVAYLP